MMKIYKVYENETFNFTKEEPKGSYYKEDFSHTRIEPVTVDVPAPEYDVINEKDFILEVLELEQETIGLADDCCDFTHDFIDELYELYDQLELLEKHFIKSHELQYIHNFESINAMIFIQIQDETIKVVYTQDEIRKEIANAIIGVLSQKTKYEIEVLK